MSSPSCPELLPLSVYMNGLRGTTSVVLEISAIAAIVFGLAFAIGIPRLLRHSIGPVVGGHLYVGPFVPHQNNPDPVRWDRPEQLTLSTEPVRCSARCCGVTETRETSASITRWRFNMSDEATAAKKIRARDPPSRFEP
jgi:hypothetical protein